AHSGRVPVSVGTLKGTVGMVGGTRPRMLGRKPVGRAGACRPYLQPGVATCFTDPTRLCRRTVAGPSRRDEKRLISVTPPIGLDPPPSAGGSGTDTRTDCTGPRSAGTSTTKEYATCR